MFLFLLCALGLAAPCVCAGEPSAVAKHIILIVGDGMTFENEIAAGRYLAGTDDGLSFHGFPYRGWVATWDVTVYNRKALHAGASPYNPSAVDPKAGCDAVLRGEGPGRATRARYSCRVPEGAGAGAADSASTATAWATGQKTDTGNIAWLPGDPDGGALRTVAELLREKRGVAVGIVTTVPFSDATTAAMVSHNTNRRNRHAIADEILRTVQPEVVIGGGHPAWGGPKHMSTALYDDVRSWKLGAWVFVERGKGADARRALEDSAARAAGQGRKLFGLFGGPGGNFEAPVPTGDGTAAVKRATVENPLLGEATKAALTVLSKNRNGFFLVVEQGDIDRANHAGDYTWMIGAMWDLDGAVRAAVDFVNRPGDGVTWENTLLIVTADHATGAIRFDESRRLGKGRLPVQATGLCPDRAARCPRYPGGEVSYTATKHLNEPVSIYAMGNPGLTSHLRRYEGSWYPCTPLIDNTQLFHAVTDAAGIPQRPALRAIVARPAVCPAGD